MTRKKSGDPHLAIGYIRVSTEEQALGPEAQAAQLAAWADSKKITIVETFRDIGVSGATALDRRPGLLAALDSLKEHKAGSLVAAKRDRFARDVLVAAQIERLTAREGGQVVSADGAGAGDGPEAALMRRIVDAFAEYERALIRARTSAALRAKLARGEAAGGHAPYGWQIVSGRLVGAPEEQAGLALIQTLRSRGYSLREILSVLTHRGIPPRGRKWHLTSLHRIVLALETGAPAAIRT